MARELTAAVPLDDDEPIAAENAEEAVESAEG